MEILIISFDADPPFYGGVSLVTHILGEEFTKLGHNCTLGYLKETEHPSVYFKNKLKISKDNKTNIEKYANKKKFDCIITQFLHVDYSLLKLLISENGKIISVYHSKPELRYFSISFYFKNIISSNCFKHILWSFYHILLFPIFKKIDITKDRKMYNNSYKNSDKLVVLSKKFIPLLKNILINKEFSKVCAIPNPLVYKEQFKIENLPLKKKEVLVVANFDPLKNINKIIRVWNEIEKDSNFSDWHLTIVGTGTTFTRDTRLAKNLGLKNITFVGKKDPKHLYFYSSIFLMMSKYEGFPMTLLESLQNGVVPIVYNSFESVTDLIINRQNGILIDNNNFDLYIKELKLLMSNNIKLKEYAANAIISCQKFSRDMVVNKYIELHSK